MAPVGVEALEEELKKSRFSRSWFGLLLFGEREKKQVLDMGWYSLCYDKFLVLFFVNTVELIMKDHPDKRHPYFKTTIPETHPSCGVCVCVCVCACVCACMCVCVCVGMCVRVYVFQ